MLILIGAGKGAYSKRLRPDDPLAILQTEESSYDTPASRQLPLPAQSPAPALPSQPPQLEPIASSPGTASGMHQDATDVFEQPGVASQMGTDEGGPDVELSQFASFSAPHAVANDLLDRQQSSAILNSVRAEDQQSSAILPSTREQPNLTQTSSVKSNDFEVLWVRSEPHPLRHPPEDNAVKSLGYQANHTITERSDQQLLGNTEIHDPFAHTFPTALIAPTVEESWQEECDEWDTFQAPTAEDNVEIAQDMPGKIIVATCHICLSRWSAYRVCKELVMQDPKSFNLNLAQYYALFLKSLHCRYQRWRY